MRTPPLPSFVDGKDNLDEYLLRFERYASVAKWNKSTWATQLSPLLTGKAVEVYNRLSPEEAMDYERLKVALLERYDFTERGYREKFREARPEGHESPSQFIFSLKNYFTKWVELAEVEQTFMGVVDLVELKLGEKIKVVRNGACLSNENKNCMLLATGKVVENEVEVLGDTGCNSVIVRRELVKKEDYTGSMGYVMAIDRTLKEAPIAEIKVDTPYYTRVTQAICLRNPLFDLVIGNIPEARNPDDPVSGMETCAAAITRAQARKDITVKPLVTKEVTTQTSITKNELAKLQQEDTTLEKYADLEDAVRRGDYEIKYERRKDVLYRIQNRVDGLGECSKQIMVPKTLRRKVMEVAHDSIFGGHLAIKKTKDRIQTNFYWHGIQGDITSFCRSCDVCQKTTAKGSVPRVPLGDMPLIDMPFRRVAVDLVGPISPPSEKGHRYILTLVDYATRYPEAVPLKNIETETVAEALMDMYSRLGIPKEVLSDLGTQFVSKCMEEVSRLLSIKRLTTPPYHSICNGLVERLNGTLKKMLRRLCNEQPRQWHRFVNPLLFAYREAPQETTGFLPFQ